MKNRKLFMLKLVKAKQYFIKAIETLQRTPEGKVLEIEYLDGDIPGEITLMTSYVDPPNLGVEDDYED